MKKLEYKKEYENQDIDIICYDLKNKSDYIIFNKRKTDTPKDYYKRIIEHINLNLGYCYSKAIIKIN